jgi:hypothetical protein
MADEAQPMTDLALAKAIFTQSVALAMAQGTFGVTLTAEAAAKQALENARTFSEVSIANLKSSRV